MDEIIASRKELSMLLGLAEKQICEGLDELQFCNMVQLTEVAGKPLRIRAQLNIDSWNVVHLQPFDQSKKLTLGDAKNLHSLLPNEPHPNKKNIKLIELNIFDDPIPFPKQKTPHLKVTKNEEGMPTKEQSSLNNLDAFREKNEVIDSKIKALAVNELDLIKHEKRLITPNEDLLLQILSQHHQPRKQLILALNSNVNYPNLKFFLATAKVVAEIVDPNKKK
ncbi:MAG: hypothetical protein V4591_08180 [Bdellovibrionota bacterium]